MPTEMIFIDTYVCDKCGHNWVSKQKNSIKNLSLQSCNKISKEMNKNEKNFEKTQEFKKKYNLKEPKICPHCKSKKWNESKTIGGIDKDMIKAIEKAKGKECADSVRCRIDKDFHKKKVLEEIDRLKKEIENHILKAKLTANAIKSGEAYLKELEKELSDLNKG